MPIYAIKTIVGRERVTMKGIKGRVIEENLDIKAIVHPEELKGYIFIEGEIDEIEKAVANMPNVRGIIRKPISVEEIKKFLIPKKVEIELNVGDLVEVIGGPFKGERGKVKRYDKAKREVTIELLEATVPIPITVAADLVRVIEKKGE
ncbi:MAG: transcription elongation factor Spt5 [Candidatus Aenigmarchaeota archaeon ex4484_224]|nr:MAG: transcription elongation factor Spt5 [Candidatus Aenigmarchaeota archaeon ex4484_224]